MIISASRRTDIPAFYSDWFINRINAEHVLVRNPFNPRHTRRVILSPEAVECIVFWTKNPSNIMDKLDFLDEKGYKYYFLFTITGYGREIELNIPEKEEILKTTKLDEKNIKKWYAKQAQRIAKAKQARRLGIIVSTKPGQHNTKQINVLKSKVKDKKVHTFICDEVNAQQLMNFPDIDAWINTACPRLVEDEFNKPVVNIEEFIKAI